jgi:apolipoprotein N-acyltransferase
MGTAEKRISKPTWGERFAALLQDVTLRVGVVGALLLWACLPPLGLAPLAWIAPVPWLWLARLPVLPGRRPYLALWSSGAVFWVLTNHWLRLPHPATSLGWFTLSFYLACFTPLLVGLMRVAARFRLSIVVSGPMLWVAADQARAYLWTGFSMSSLCHSQWRTPWAVQSADLCGEFGVTFAMVMVAAALARMLPVPGAAGWSPRWLTLAIAVPVAMFGYGHMQLQSVEPAGPRLKIALIQGSIESDVKHDPSKLPIIYDHYLKLSQQAVAADSSVQLVVWPETMFPYPYWMWTDDVAPGPNDTWTAEQIIQTGRHFRDLIASTARTIGKPLLLGIAAAEFGPGRVKGYNSVLHVDVEGKPLGRYDKQHRVIFGEYIPLADLIPWLYTITPLTGGIEAGSEAKAFEIGGVRLSPDVCYETTLSRVILRQVAELRARGEEPDVLVNVTNDGWFRGSSELDLHLACAVFRAVEMRKPLVIAANTGFSAVIDSRGIVEQQGPRRAAGFLIAEVEGSRGGSFFLRIGNALAWSCLIGAIVLAAAGWATRNRT